MRESLIVSYDLRGRDERSSDYGPLIEAIKDYGYWGKLMLSTWIIVTASSAEEVRDNLAQHLRPKDRIFVGPLGKPAAWRNVIADSDWLKDRP